jgi:hypothetical protein
MVLSKKKSKKFNKTNHKSQKLKKYKGGSLDLDSIKKLSDLKDKHMITAEEYIEAKQSILNPGKKLNNQSQNSNPTHNSNSSSSSNSNSSSSSSSNSNGILGMLSNIGGGIFGGSNQGLMKKGISMAISAATFPARMMINTALSLFGNKNKNEMENTFNNQVINDNHDADRNNSMNNIEPGAPKGGGLNCVASVKKLSNSCGQPDQLLDIHDQIVKKLKNTSKGFFSDENNKKIDDIKYLNSQKGGGYLTKKNRKNRKNKKRKKRRKTKRKLN